MTVGEGGVRTPLLISGSKIDGGKRVDSFAYVWDLMPTILDIAGIEHPDSYQGRPVEPMRGRSLKGVRKGTAQGVYGVDEVVAGELPPSEAASRSPSPRFLGVPQRPAIGIGSTCRRLPPTRRAKQADAHGRGATGRRRSVPASKPGRPPGAGPWRRIKPTPPQRQAEVLLGQQYQRQECRRFGPLLPELPVRLRAAGRRERLPDRTPTTGNPWMKLKRCRPFRRRASSSAATPARGHRRKGSRGRCLTVVSHR